MIYEYSCESCGKELEAIRPIALHAQGPVCCGVMSKQVIRTAPRGYVDNMTEYECPVTHQGVTTRRQRDYIMQSNDLVDANDFHRTSAQRKAAKAEKDAEIQAIKDEVPQDLKDTFELIKKDEEKRFLANR